MDDIILGSAVRTPIGSFEGVLNLPLIDSPVVHDTAEDTRGSKNDSAKGRTSAASLIST